MNTAARGGNFSQRWLKNPDEPRELDPLLLWPAVALLQPRPRPWKSRPSSPSR